MNLDLLSPKYYYRGYKWLENPYYYLDTKMKNEGLTFRDTIPVLGNVLFTGQPEYIEQISQDPIFQDKKSFSALTEILGKNSLIALVGEQHKKRRAALSPGFRATFMSSLNENLYAMAQTQAQKNLEGTAFDVVQQISVRLTIRSMFHLSEEMEEELGRRTVHFMNSFQHPLVLFVPALKVNLSSASPWGRALANRKSLVSFLQDVLRKKQFSVSILSSVLSELEKLSLSEEEVINEFITLLMFGHDTTAAALSWTISQLATRKDYQERIQQEVEDFKARGETPSLEAFPFTNSCVNEGLRLSPPVVHLTRSASQDTQLGPFQIKAGDTVLPSAYISHQNAAVFSQPKEFNPDRNFKEISKYSFYPYGLSHRICIGKPLAQQQMVLMLASLLEWNTFSPGPKYSLEPQRKTVLIAPKYGGDVLFKKRFS